MWEVFLSCFHWIYTSWGGHTRECLGGVTTEEALLQEEAVQWVLTPQFLIIAMLQWDRTEFDQLE